MAAEMPYFRVAYQSLPVPVRYPVTRRPKVWALSVGLPVPRLVVLRLLRYLK